MFAGGVCPILLFCATSAIHFDPAIYGRLGRIRCRLFDRCIGLAYGNLRFVAIVQSVRFQGRAVLGVFKPLFYRPVQVAGAFIDLATSRRSYAVALVHTMLHAISLKSVTSATGLRGDIRREATTRRSF